MEGTHGCPVSRRAFVKRAVALGGAAALAACLDREAAVDVPRGVDDPGTLPDRQHAWNAVLGRDDADNPVMPRHHVLLLADYAGDGAPDATDRDAVEGALRGLERAYARSNDGLLFTVGYSRAYFDRFDASLPGSVDLPETRALSPLEDPALDRPDVLIHLASDHGSVVLAAERALLGEVEEANGVTVRESLADVLAVTGRRTGFVGPGLPAAHQDVAGIPDTEPVDEEAPLYMGFKSGFRRNQATEERVTIPEGPFADGTTAHLSKLRLNLEQWYEQDSREQRVAKMFCPVHADRGLVEGVGENLGDTSRIEESGCAEAVEEHARTRGMVGHSQKLARVREDGAPLILRRDFDSTDGGRAGLHFLSLQRRIADFVVTREAMNGTDLVGTTAVGRRNNNGILQYVETERRGNYLVPPRRHRAFPTPRPA